MGSVKKMWKKKKESSGQKDKGCRWSKYVCMKRRTESLLDLVEKKGALRPGFSGTRPQKFKSFRRREKSCDGNLLKKVLYRNYIKSEKEDFLAKE